MTIKAIETRYAGCRFRSRLEARWAVFFDALKIEWQYEPQGFELPLSGRYLPDFYLPSLATNGAYIEIKPKHPLSDREASCGIELGWLLAREADPTFYAIFIGDIPRDSREGAIEMWAATPRTVDTPDGRFRLPEDREHALRIPQEWLENVPVSHWSLQNCALQLDGDVDAALTVARSARFEHGEKG